LFAVTRISCAKVPFSSIRSLPSFINQSNNKSLNWCHLQLYQIHCDNTAMGSPIKKQKLEETLFEAGDKHRLIWIDLEMTGLEVQTDTILEIACIITEGNLDIVAEGPNLIIHHSDKVLDNMNAWCIEQHGKSGLTASVKASKISLAEAETQVLDFVSKHTPKGVCPLAGNSIGMDKRFLDKYMPSLAAHFHYRVVDVSTIKELCRRWSPETLKRVPPKQLTHRALDDIKESIDELQFYRTELFK